MKMKKTSVRRRVNALVLMLAVFATVAGGLVLLATPSVEAARCCWVMVCSTTPPYACWEQCKPCPKFP
jgi:hypothetical protein